MEDALINVIGFVACVIAYGGIGTVLDKLRSNK